MTRDSEYSPLFQLSRLVLVVGALLVTLCYFFVDRPVAYWVRDEGFSSFVVLKWLTYPPPIIQTWAPAVRGGGQPDRGRACRIRFICFMRFMKQTGGAPF